MKKVNVLIFTLVVIISALALTIFLRDTRTPEIPTSQPVQTPPSVPVKKPIVHYPVPVPTPIPTPPQQQPPPAPRKEQQPVAVTAPELPKKLPPVQQSDESFRRALKSLKLDKPLFNLILVENLIQRLVVTIDNLPEKRLPRAHLPLVPPKGRFITSGTTESPQTSSRNWSRYNLQMQLLETLDQDLVLKIYVYFYPLFQTAYEQLGYQNAYFNDRLINVIDHLLETPNPPEPIQLAQPSVLYVYADPLLEKLSAGQKILLRIGPDHRWKLLKILESYREKLINLQP
ncbi:MAG: DUF3014 domain-containing protein [Deltaproteobacteria bacterium]|nr:DUF3014 domain-containing protein [Deltaproteobacteria bacterium]